MIPLDGDPRNVADLRRLRSEISQHEIGLVFVTGRHLASIIHAMDEFELPQPDWIVCDVGSSLYQRDASNSFVPVKEYHACLQTILGEDSFEAIQKRLPSELPQLRLQEPEKQGRFKLSFYTDAGQLQSQSELLSQSLNAMGVAHSLIASVDPFNNDGLLDVLPRDVSKAFALQWWCKFSGCPAEQVVFAGDSGNDLAAMTAGYRTIVVGNADRKLASAVAEVHRNAAWENRLFLADSTATSGVREGLQWFGML